MAQVRELKIKLIMDFHTSITELSKDFEEKHDLNVVSDLESLITNFERSYEPLIQC